MTDLMPAGEPLVSVIIPVYNVENFLRFTLDSTTNQGLEPGQMEIIAVDDGSTDKSGEILHEYAAEHEHIKVLHQANSGGPGSPRNHGIEKARGKYLFFLDSDDELTKNALRDLVKVAESEGSDVVLGKGEGINGRVVPGPVFRATRLNADLIDDNVYRTLSPWKLFRKSLIDDGEIRFLETISVGEDQPFVARAYLRAKKISVLADRPYARLRARGDGTNVTSSARSLRDLLELAEAVIAVLAAESEPGRIRDGFLARPVKRQLRPLLQPQLLDLPDSEQLALLVALGDLLRPYYNDVVAGHLSGLDRVKMDLAISSDLDVLREIIRWEAENSSALYTVDSMGIVYDLPHDLVPATGAVRADVESLVVTTTLRSLKVDGPEVRLVAEASVRGLPERASEISLRLRGRRSGQERDIAAAWSHPNSEDATGKRFDCTVDSRELDDDVWDLLVVQSFDGHEIVRRFGDKRLATVSTGKHLLREGMDALGVAYFTKGRGYLALDIGMQITAHRLPVASILALIPRSADVMAVVSVSSPTDVQLAVAGSSASTPPSGESAEDEVMELSSGVYGVPLRLGKLAASEELQITVENEAGRVSASAVPELAESTSASGVGVNVKREEPQRLLIRKEQADRSHGRSSTLIRRAYSWLTHRR